MLINVVLVNGSMHGVIKHEIVIKWEHQCNNSPCMNWRVSICVSWNLGILCFFLPQVICDVLLSNPVGSIHIAWWRCIQYILQAQVAHKDTMDRSPALDIQVTIY
jgi:hypothetical protein